MSEIRTAKFADAVALADRLRFEDAREIAASWGLGAREGLFHCLLQSDRSFTLFQDGEPEALWGVTGTRDAGLRIGIPWMLAGERLFERRRALLGKSRRLIRHLLLDYDVLTNLTDAGNDAHLRWLGWCGFRVLRRHERHGVAGRPFIEFYQQNARSRISDAAVQAILLRRSTPRCAPPGNEIVNALVKVGIGVLSEAGRSDRPGVDALAALLGQLETAAVVDARTRRGCIRLLLEIAVWVSGWPAHGERRPRRDDPLAELLAALADVADLLVLEQHADGADLVLALDPTRTSARSEPNRQPVSAGVRPVRQGGAAAFQWLIRRYLRMLTVDGRVSRVHGARLWAAAAGAGGESVQRPLGISRLRLWELLTDFHLSRALAEGVGFRITELTERRRDLLETPVGHAQAVARMRAVCTRGDPVDRAVAAQLDGCTPDDVAPPRAEKIRTLGDVLSVASAIADRTAQHVLPSLRVGGVVSGYADRHWLYRLLRLRLAAAASGSAPGALVPLLIDDVTGLLLAARVEDQLLGGEAAAPATEEVDALLREACSLWGPGIEIDDDFSHLLGLLVPALALPAVHAVQLPPALLVWHLAVTGGLEECMNGIGNVAGTDGPGSRRRYRNFLRTRSRDLSIVTFGGHLGMRVDAEQTEPDASFAVAGGQ